MTPSIIHEFDRSSESSDDDCSEVSSSDFDSDDSDGSSAVIFLQKVSRRDLYGRHCCSAHSVSDISMYSYSDVSSDEEDLERSSCSNWNLPITKISDHRTGTALECPSDDDFTFESFYSSSYSMSNSYDGNESFIEETIHEGEDELVPANTETHFEKPTNIPLDRMNRENAFRESLHSKKLPRRRLRKSSSHHSGKGWVRSNHSRTRLDRSNHSGSLLDRSNHTSPSLGNRRSNAGDSRKRPRRRLRGGKKSLAMCGLDILEPLKKEQGDASNEDIQNVQKAMVLEIKRQLGLVKEMASLKNELQRLQLDEREDSLELSTALNETERLKREKGKSSNFVEKNNGTERTIVSQEFLTDEEVDSSNKLLLQSNDTELISFRKDESIRFPHAEMKEQVQFKMEEMALASSKVSNQNTSASSRVSNYASTRFSAFARSFKEELNKSKSNIAFRRN